METKYMDRAEKAFLERYSTFMETGYKPRLAASCRLCGDDAPLSCRLCGDD